MKNLLENTIKIIGLFVVAVTGWFVLPFVMIYEKIEEEEQAQAYISTACFTVLACLYVLFPHSQLFLVFSFQ